MHLKQLPLIRSAHHRDRRLIAIHKNLLTRIEQKNGIGAALKQQWEHRFSVTQRRAVGTTPFVPLLAGRVQRIHQRMKGQEFSKTVSHGSEFSKLKRELQAQPIVFRPAPNTANSTKFNKFM